MKVTIELSPEILKQIDSITLLTGRTTDEVIKYAIAHELHIQKHIKSGSKILAFTSDKELKEILFK